MIDEAEKYAAQLLRLIVQARTNKEALTHGVCQCNDGEFLEMALTMANMSIVNGTSYTPLKSEKPSAWGEELAVAIMFTAGELALQMLPWSNLILRFETNEIPRTLLIENEGDGVAEVTLINCDDIDADAMGEDFSRLDNGFINVVIVDE
jgi:hypothetical protein